MSCVLLAAVATFVGGYGFRGCNAQGPEDQRAQRESIPVVKAGDLPVSLDMIKTTADNQLQQYSGMDLPESLKLELGEGGALNMFINNGLALKLAKQQGIDLSDETIRRKIMESEIEGLRSKLEQAGKLRPGASEQELETAYKALSGKSLVDDRKSSEESLKARLDDPGGRELMQSSMAMQLLIDKNKSKYIPTEDTVKEEYRTYHFKSINFSDSKSGAHDAVAKANEARRAIMAGMSFEAAMDKYATGKPAKGKKASDEKTDLTKYQLENDAEKKPLLSMKPNQVSEVMPSGAGATIYKFYNETLDLPKDWATKKAELIDFKAKGDAGKALQEQVKALDTPANIVWKNEGYHIFHDYLDAKSASPTGPAQAKKMQEILDRAMKAQDDPQSAQIAAATAMVALDDATRGLPPDAAAKLKVSVLEAYVQQYPELPAKIDLIEAYVATGNKDRLASALHSAADSNSIRLDQEGTTNWVRIARAEKDALAKKLIEKTDAEDIDKLHAQWMTEYADRKAEDKKLADERKKTEDELKKAGKPQEGTPMTPGPKKPESGKPEPKKPSGTTKKPAGKP